MLKFKIKEKLYGTGKLYPQTWLIKHCGFGQRKAHNIFHSSQKAITLKDLSILCEKLDCTPNDLFYWENSGHTKLREDHPCITELRPPDKVGGLYNLIKKMTAAEVEAYYQTGLKNFENK